MKRWVPALPVILALLGGGLFWWSVTERPNPIGLEGGGVGAVLPGADLESPRATGVPRSTSESKGATPQVAGGEAHSTPTPRGEAVDESPPAAGARRALEDPERAVRGAEAPGASRSGAEGEGEGEVRPGRRGVAGVTDVPGPPPDDPPPPPGRARLKAGSIPIEDALYLNGEQVSSFVLGKRSLPPGLYEVRLVRGAGCVRFSVELGPDETVYLIWDFDRAHWRWHERRGPRGRTEETPTVVSCEQP